MFFDEFYYSSINRVYPLETVVDKSLQWFKRKGYVFDKKIWGEVVTPLLKEMQEKNRVL